MSPEHYNHLRLLSVGDRAYSLSVRRHRNQQPTNPIKTWDRYAGCLVLDGSGTYEDWNGSVLPIEPGSFVHHLPDKYHHIERSPGGWEECSLAFDAELYHRLRDLGCVDESRGVVTVGTGTELVAAYARLGNALSAATDQDTPRLLLETARLLVRVRELAETVQDRSREEIAVDAARERLARDFAREVDLEALAAEAGFSYPHFRRMFRQITGQSPGAYRNDQRMEQARLLLTYRRVRVAEVATRLGYADAFVFSRQFRKRFGMPPTEYARKHRAE